MLTPPPISSQAYPTVVGSEVRSNYLTAGLIFTTAYNDNVLEGASTTPIGDVTYSIWPTIALNRTTPRQQWALTYTPGFTFYQHTTALNAADQNANFNFQYRLSQHVTVSLNDSFQQSSNVFSQPNSISGAPISGSSQSAPTEVLAPYADRISNVANVGLSYQFSENGMMGFGGIATQSNYPNPSEASGLYNSNSFGGSAFYNHRLSSGQYLGLTYQYLKSDSDPVDAEADPASSSIEVQTQTLLPFYTIYFNPTFSLSLSGGPQHIDAAQSLSPSVREWEPAAMASIAWQSRSTNLVASYTRTITGGVGLPGAFNSNNANASVRWKISRAWIVGAGVGYAINKNITPLFTPYSPGGHTISASVSLEYSTRDHFKAELGYVRLHQSYSGIALISDAPDSNREFVSISYQFTRGLGR